MRQTELKEGLYTKREISPNYTLFWRIIPDTDEIEMALRVKGTGYVGIGWRPKSATKQCQAYPKLYDKETAAKSLWTDDEDKSAQAESEGEPETEPEIYADDAEAESLEEAIESAENSKELKRKARRIVNKSIDVSIGYVTHSVSTGKRRKRQTNEGKMKVFVFFWKFAESFISCRNRGRTNNC